MNPGGIIDDGAVFAMRADDVPRLPEPSLVAAAVDISREIARLEALRVAVVAEIDARPVPLDVLGFRDVRQWLASKTLLEVPAATRILSLGRALGRDPVIAEAFHAGRVSADHASLIAKFCERPPHGMPDAALGPCRDVLLQSATGPTATTDGVRRCITKLERIFESDELPASEDTDRNEFHASKTLNGRVAVKGDLDAETGEMLLTTLSALTKPRNPADDPANTRSTGQRRAEAFGELLRRYLDSGAAPVEGGERPHVSLHVNARDLARADTEHRNGRDGHRAAGTFGDLDGFGDLAGLDDDGGSDASDVAWMPWMGPLSIQSARRLVCDCHLTPIVVDDGVPLDLGRTTRTVPKKQRRALIARDHGCAFPGCGAPPAHCEGHHIHHWADGGATDLDNLVLLCRFHHRLLHHSHWEVHIGSDRHPYFTPPSTVDPFKKPVPAHNRAGPSAA